MENYRRFLGVFIEATLSAHFPENKPYRIVRAYIGIDIVLRHN